jgi:hypothetical protein
MRPGHAQWGHKRGDIFDEMKPEIMSNGFAVPNAPSRSGVGASTSGFNDALPVRSSR